MRVEVVGRKGPARASITYEMIDFYDRKKKVTSMGKTTGFTCSMVTRMAGRGEVHGIGVVTPEVALNTKLVQKVHSELKTKGGKRTESQEFESVHYVRD